MSRFSVASLVTLLAAALLGCGNSTEATAALAGSYRATTFTIQPSGLNALDILPAGGSISITIAPSGAITGSLLIPNAITGDGDFLADMAGTASVSGNTVRFEQPVDSFMRDLRWTIDGNTLRAVNQLAGSSRFTVVLTR